MTPITPDDLAKAKEYVIETGVKAFVAEGMTPEAARQRAEKAMNAPWPDHWPKLPSFDDL